MVPHNAVQFYIHMNMRSWRLRRVKTLETTIFFVQALLVLITWTLGMTVYKAGIITNARDTDNLMFTINCMVMYCYLFYWSIIGIFTVILFLVLAYKKIIYYICSFSFRNRGREEQEADIEE